MTEPISIRSALLGVLALLALGASGCHRERKEPRPVQESVAPADPVPAPAELLLEGAVRRPSEVWQRLRALLGGRAALLPSSFGLAITTLVGASPLTAGLVDETAAIPVVVLDGKAEGVGIVAAVHLTSGAELTVALANGADARFVAEADKAHGITLLRRTPGSKASSASEESPSLGIAGDYLLIGKSLQQIRLGGAYAARTLSRSVGDGAVLSLTAPKAALRGPLSASLRTYFASLREGLQVSDLATRAQHGGRAPDFAEPAAVIAALSSAFDGVAAVVESADALRISVALLDPSPLVRVEIVPGTNGAAREFVSALATGSAEPLLLLPGFTQTAVLWQQASAGDGGPGVRFASLFGDRLAAADRRKLERWSADVEHGLGTTAVAGLFGSNTQLGLFVAGDHGDGASLSRATETLPDIAAIPAVAAPLKAFLGQLDVRRGDGVAEGLGRITRVRIRALAPGPSTTGMPSAVEVVAAARGQRTAIVLASGDAGARLAELLEPEKGSPIGKEPVVARAVLHAGGESAYALVSRVENAAAHGVIVVTVGSDRKVAWSECGMSDVALAVLANAWLGH